MQPFPLYYCILQVIKTGQWEGLGTRLLVDSLHALGYELNFLIKCLLSYAL